MTSDDSAPERELAELRGAVLDDWMHAVEWSQVELRGLQSSLSWRVTKPLRYARVLVGKSRELGVISTAQLAAVEVARRLGRRP